MPSYPVGIPLLQDANDTMLFESLVEKARNLHSLLVIFVDCSGL